MKNTVPCKFIKLNPYHIGLSAAIGNVADFLDIFQTLLYRCV